MTTTLDPRWQEVADKIDAVRAVLHRRGAGAAQRSAAAGTSPGSPRVATTTCSSARISASPRSW